MFDVVQAQKDMHAILLSSDQLLTVNVVLQRKMHEESEIDMATIFSTPRGGCSGAGVLVEMPLATCESKNVDGPVLDWIFPVLIIENPNMNYASPTPTFPARGTFLDAERILQRVLDEVHNTADEFYGTFQVDRDAVKFVSDFPGCLAYRAPFTLLKAKSLQTARVGQIQGGIADGQCTLSCANDPDADIWFTTDGSSPANGNGGNPKSLLYSGPFAVDDSVAAVRARGYKAGKIGSATKYLLNS